MRIGNKTKGFVILILSLIQLYGCKKDPVEKKDDNECEVFNTSDCFIGFSGKTIGVDIRHLTFHPTNKNALIFLRKREGEEKQILKYNLETRSESVLADDVNPGSDFSWSKLGWIVFHTSSSWKVWKLKDDGSEFTQLTYTPRDLGPEFHPDGDKLIYARNYLYGIELDTNPDLRSKYKLMTIDLKGNSIDSFCRVKQNDDCYPWDLCAWSPDGQKFAAPDKIVKLYDLNGNVIESSFDFPLDITHIGDIEWHPNGEVVFFNYDHGRMAKGSIMAWHINSGEVFPIKVGCDSRSYRGLSISPDGETLATVRIDATYSACLITQRYYPILIDIESGREIELSLD